MSSFEIFHRVPLIKASSYKSYINASTISFTLVLIRLLKAKCQSWGIVPRSVRFSIHTSRHYTPCLLGMIQSSIALSTKNLMNMNVFLGLFTKINK